MDHQLTTALISLIHTQYVTPYRENFSQAIEEMKAGKLEKETYERVKEYIQKGGPYPEYCFRQLAVALTACELDKSSAYYKWGLSAIQEIVRMAYRDPVMKLSPDGLVNIIYELSGWSEDVYKAASGQETQCINELKLLEKIKSEYISPFCERFTMEIQEMKGGKLSDESAKKLTDYILKGGPEEELGYRQIAVAIQACKANNLNPLYKWGKDALRDVVTMAYRDPVVKIPQEGLTNIIYMLSGMNDDVNETVSKEEIKCKIIARLTPKEKKVKEGPPDVSGGEPGAEP